jgi:hypothetical protein
MHSTHERLTSPARSSFATRAVSVRLLAVGAALAAAAGQALFAQLPTTRMPNTPSRLLPLRVRIDGLPTDAGLVRISVQVEATSEQITRSLPAGAVSRVLVPAGLVTVTGDTILVKRDSLGPTYYAPVLTGQAVVPDSGVAVVRYAPLTGVVEVRTEGGPPGLRALLSLYHQCEGDRSSCDTYVGSSAIPGLIGEAQVGLTGSNVRVGTARLGVWRAAIHMDFLPVDADGASVWCPSPASTSISVLAGQVASTTIRFVKRKSCK